MIEGMLIKEKRLRHRIFHVTSLLRHLSHRYFVIQMRHFDKYTCHIVKNKLYSM